MWGGGNGEGYAVQNGQGAWHRAGNRLVVRQMLVYPSQHHQPLQLASGIQKWCKCSLSFLFPYTLNGNSMSLVLVFISLARSCLAKAEVSQWRELERT